MEEGGADRAKVALDVANLCLEDEMYQRASAMYKLCIVHDGQAARAHRHERQPPTPPARA